MPIEIRDAREEDGAAIADLMSTLGYPTQPEEMSAHDGDVFSGFCWRGRSREKG